MTSIDFDGYVRITMGGARNISDGSKLSVAKIERITTYLESPGSGPDAVTSYEAYIKKNMGAHPSVLPDNYEYVPFSGTDGTGRSNYDKAIDYAAETGRAGIIGDTPWGKFVDQSSVSQELDDIEKKFKKFLTSEGVEPYGGNYKSALQDIMWNAGSEPFIENGLATAKPMRAFVDGAPPHRGFSDIELSVLLKHPEANVNGYPVKAFGGDPLTFVQHTAAEFEALEKTIAQAASVKTSTAVSIADIQANVRLIHGYDGINKTVFGQAIDEFSKLDLPQMTATSESWMRSHTHTRTPLADRIEEPERIKRPTETHPATGPPERREIGRASCRERV